MLSSSRCSRGAHIRNTLFWKGYPSALAKSGKIENIQKKHTLPPLKVICCAALTHFGTRWMNGVPFRPSALRVFCALGPLQPCCSWALKSFILVASWKGVPLRPYNFLLSVLLERVPLRPCALTLAPLSICSLISSVFLVGIMAVQGELVTKSSAAQVQSLSICSLISPVFLVGIMAAQGELVTKSSAAQAQSLSICSLISAVFF